MRVGRFLQGMLVLIWAAAHLNVNWTVSAVSLVICAIVGGACLFSGLFVFSATVCFWTVESLEVINCVTYGGVEAAQFPLSIYRAWFKSFFTFVIPLATINYFPIQALLNTNPTARSTLIAWISPLAGIAFLVLCLQFWRIGVRHYTSTGS